MPKGKGDAHTTSYSLLEGYVAIPSGRELLQASIKAEHEHVSPERFEQLYQQLEQSFVEYAKAHMLNQGESAKAVRKKLEAIKVFAVELDRAHRKYAKHQSAEDQLIYVRAGNALHEALSVQVTGKVLREALLLHLQANALSLVAMEAGLGTLIEKGDYGAIQPAVKFLADTQPESVAMHFGANNPFLLELVVKSAGEWKQVTGWSAKPTTVDAMTYEKTYRYYDWMCLMLEVFPTEELADKLSEHYGQTKRIAAALPVLKRDAVFQSVRWAETNSLISRSDAS